MYRSYGQYLDIQKKSIAKPEDSLYDATKVSARQVSIIETLRSTHEVKEKRHNSDWEHSNHEQKYKESVSSASMLSDIAYPNEAKDFLRLSNLKEHVLVKKALVLFSPVILFGILAMFFPSVYSVFPVQESEICMCSFFKMQANGDAPFLIDLEPKHAFSTFFIINTISFYVVNYLALLGMVYMVWQIRHTDDDTFLRQECVCLVLSWVFFSIIQYAVNVYNFIIQCENNNNELSDKNLIDFYETTFKIIYWVIILRDLVCLCIMVLFQYRAATS